MANRKVVVTSMVIAGSLVAVIGGGALLSQPAPDYDGNLTSGISTRITSAINEVDLVASDVKNQITKSNESSKLTKEEADEVVKEYFTDLKNEIVPVAQVFKESGKAGFNEIKGLLQSALVKTYDFTHGATSINGVYFEDLTDSGKSFVKDIMSFFNTLAVMVDPDYKAWFADKGEDFKNFIKQENVEALKDIKDGALTLGGNFIDFLDNKWEESADNYRKER